MNNLTEEVKKYENHVFKLTTQRNFVINENAKIAMIFHIEMILNILQIITTQYKSNIVSHQLLTTKELNIIFEQLEATGLKPQNLDDIYNFISVTRFYHGNHLIFSFDIPRVSSIVYEITKVEPLPSEGKIIDIGTASTFLVSNNEVLSVNTKYEQNTHIFKRKDLSNITDSCIVPLVQGLKGKCPFKEISQKTQTRFLTFGTLIVKSASNTTLSSTCGINEKELNGNYMIIFHNCSVIVQNQLFENLELQFNHPNILPIKSTQIEAKHLEKLFNVSHLHDSQLANRQHLEFLELYQHSSSGVILFIILGIIAAISYSRWNVITTAVKQRTGRASTRGGGVNNEPALGTLTQVPVTSPTSSAPAIILPSSAVVPTIPEFQRRT